MATDQEQPNEPLDAEMTWRLKSSFTAPEPRSEFVRALSQRLDQQFAETAAHGQRPALMEMLQQPAANGNGALKPLAMNGQAGKQLAEAPTSKLSKTRRTWRRWTMIATVAASLFVAIVALGPAYGWTAAIRQWVSAIVPFAGTNHQSVDSDAPATQNTELASAPVLIITDGGTRSDFTAMGDSPATRAPLTVVDVPANGSQISGGTTVLAEEVVTIAKAAPIANEQAKPEKPTYVAAEPARAKKEAPPWAPFDEPLSVEELSSRVDESLAAVWQARGIHVAAPANDVEFMRRVYLDLTGRIPSVSEVHAFLENKSPERREELIDRLLAHRDHATHFAAVLRSALLPSGVDVSGLGTGGPAKFDEWLAERFAENKPYDKIVRDLLQAEGRVSESGPLLFYAALRLNPEELAGKTARTFLGVRMECAQCHDHPFDNSVSQQDFWSFAAFFARISRPKGKMDVTSPLLQVRDSQQGDVMIPQSETVVAPRLPLTELSIDDDPEGPSRRRQLVDWLTAKNNGQFARATVNRVWAHLFGRGLVEPVDDMRPANEPISPEVLDTLSRDFAASGFDLRKLFRALVLTKTYQLSSKSEENDPSRTLYFAQMNIKSFTADQLYDCITIATRQGGSSPTAAMSPELAAVVDRQDSGRLAFIEQFRAPPGQATDYHAGIPQALTLMHGGLIHGATDLNSSGLLKSLSMPFMSAEERLDALFLATLSRRPEPSEREVMLEQLTAAKTAQARQQVLGDILWALLNSGEFTFNH